jgi:lysophospholipase L1-like esterase
MKKSFLSRAFLPAAISLLAMNCLYAQSTNTAIIPEPRDDKWVARHEGFVKEAESTAADVVFLGDSITDGWRSGGKKVWDENIAPLHAVNLGISGDRTQHVLWRIDHGELDHVKPKVIVLMIGTNNTGKGRNSTPETIEGVTAVVKSLRSKEPGAKILLLGIFPRGEKDTPIRGELKEINAAISKLDDGKKVIYLDIGQKFLEPDGTLSKEIMPDLLHPNKKGYRIWADAIMPQLTSMLK